MWIVREGVKHVHECVIGARNESKKMTRPARIKRGCELEFHGTKERLSEEKRNKRHGR